MKILDVIKKKGLLTAITLSAFLTGCQNDQAIATYEYDTPESVNELTINKSVFKENSLCIFVSGKDATRIKECACYDKDCNHIDYDWELSVSKSQIVISGEPASEISGVTLYVESSEGEYKVRYLDSNRCAMLYGAYVLDAGTMYTGDEERFKTQMEKDRIEEQNQIQMEALDKSYGFLEGNWHSESDISNYIQVFTDDSDVRQFKMNGAEYLFDKLYAVEDNEGNTEVVISGDGWDSPYDIIFLDFNNDFVEHFGEKYYRDTDEHEWDEEQFGSNPGRLYFYESLDLLSSSNPSDGKSPEDSMRTVVNNSSEEEAFISMFITDYDNCIEYNYPNSDVLVSKNYTKTDMVFLISQNEGFEYPKTAYGCRFKAEDMKLEAIIKQVPDTVNELEYYSPNGPAYTDQFELLNPYKDKYEYIDDMYDTEGNLIKRTYSSDANEYGTYDSTGTIYYDKDMMPFYKYYYVTSGEHSTFYIREDGKLKWICDFGGMAYSGMEGNDNIEIGIDFKIYQFRY